MTNIRTIALEIGGVALSYWLLYYVNGWVFASFGVTSTISWVFLPAAIRMIAVLLFNWRGVAGLFAGTLATCVPVLGIASADTYIFPILSSICPLLAALLGSHLMNVRADLGGLRAWQLLVFALLGAAFNSVSHNLYFQYSGIAQSWLTGLFPMFAGDLVGMLIVLYAASALLRSISSRSTHLNP